MGADWRNDASLEGSNLREIHYFPDNNAEKRLLLDGQDGERASIDSYKKLSEFVQYFV